MTLFPTIEIVIRPNHVAVRNLDSGTAASADGPFSCDHLLVDDVDILEHVMIRALLSVRNPFWSFPTLQVSTAGRAIHIIEQKIIRDALTNAGARRVVFDGDVRTPEEQRAARSAYVQQARKR